ncbi:unnamed protein product [Protopolystoma xenopodis]|uniref:Uncharacterized protein n=1 Tax=Protopolystoma xenopodis TaxID=117903 RepID=A0A3S5CJW8_9PLAT|nr:unnamed protein product [Protopolystoma xenopodis]
MHFYGIYFGPVTLLLASLFLILFSGSPSLLISVLVYPGAFLSPCFYIKCCPNRLNPLLLESTSFVLLMIAQPMSPVLCRLSCQMASARSLRILIQN